LFQKSFFCVNNTPYWLLTGHSDGGGTLTLENPTGLDLLDGHAWGGTTPEDLIARYGSKFCSDVKSISYERELTEYLYSATLAWSNNGNQNTGAIGLDPTNVDQLGTLTGSSTVANIPGIVNLPVCSLEQAAKAADADPNNASGNPYWPCPASGVTGTGDGT
jgi:hypothetical protein